MGSPSGRTLPDQVLDQLLSKMVPGWEGIPEDVREQLRSVARERAAHEASITHDGIRALNDERYAEKLFPELRRPER